jgi:hypothetical protein
MRAVVLADRCSAAQEAPAMDFEHLDRLARALAAGVSRRSILRRAAGSAITSPLALVGISATAAQGTKDKDKDKDTDKKAKGTQGNQSGEGGPGASACRGEGHPCEGNQVCCAGLDCPEAKGTTPPGNARRCTAQAQTAVTTQTNQQTVIVENAASFGTPPSYWIDVACTFDAPLYRTVCDCIAYGQPTALAVHTITLPTADICALVITEEMRPPDAARTTTNEATGGEANAGTGGVANADASGGSVTVGDVSGNDANIAIDASGGTANANASGGASNVAIAGGGQIGNETAQAGELGRLTLTLEGNVVPGKATTYWVETDGGRRPAPGAALVQVDDTAADAGVIIAEARTCAIGEAQPDYDWFGQCTTPAVDMRFTLLPATGDGGPLATMATNAQGRAHFGGLAPGTYLLQPEGTVWCYAESDRVDSNGNIIVEAGVESHVWSFVCSGPRGS